MTQIESRIKPEKIIASNSLDAFSLGRSKEEQSYRRWALKNNLFLNPLMAIGPHAIAATDRMNLPSYVSPIGDPPTFIAWFNQMKQEYVAARWFLYEGTLPAKKHFVDKDVFLANTLDYPAFGIQVEKLRASFRIAFGLLDKIAGFINAYYQVGMDPKRVDIRNIWHTNKREMRPQFLTRKIWPSADFTGLHLTSSETTRRIRTPLRLRRLNSSGFAIFWSIVASFCARWMLIALWVRLKLRLGRISRVTRCTF